MSPFEKMRPPRLPDTRARVLSELDIRALVATASGRSFDDRGDATILRVFLGTGIRLAELANLRFDLRDETSDVDLELQRLRVLGKGRRERLVS